MDESLPPLHPFWGPTCSLPPGGPRPCQSIRDYYTMQCGQNDGCTAAGPVNLTLIINNAVKKKLNLIFFSVGFPEYVQLWLSRRKKDVKEKE